MTPEAKLRALVDRLNKNAAKAPATGGDARMQSEVVGTSAIARNQAMERTRKAQPVRPMPLRELQRKRQ